MDISFIIPVYNVKQMLSECVESIKQEYLKEYDYEIILVDDGSTDGSGELCDGIAEGYDKVKVIHRENGGLSAARNTGLKAAQGEYVIFIDSDDKLIDDKLSSLLETAFKYKTDVCRGDFEYLFDDKNTYPNVIKQFVAESPITGIDYVKKSVENSDLQMMVWMNIYRRKFLLDNDLFFAEGLNHEDEEWSPRMFYAAESVVSVPQVFYSYFIRDNSISNDRSKLAKSSLDQIKVCYRIKDYISKWKDAGMVSIMQDRAVGMYLSAFTRGKLVDRKYRNLINNKFFSGMNMSKKNKIKVIMFKFSKNLYYRISIKSQNKYLNKVRGK